MLESIKNNRVQGLSSQSLGNSNGSAGASVSGVQLSSVMQQVSEMRGGIPNQVGGEESGANGNVKQIKSEINLLYIQLAEIQKSSVGPNEVRQSPWTSGPTANYQTGQKEQIMALVRIKEEKLKAIENFGGGSSNRAAFNNLMNVYNQMEDMAKLQDFDPSYKGFNSPSITTNSYVFDKMTNLRSLAEIYKAQIANSQ